MSFTYIYYQEQLQSGKVTISNSYTIECFLMVILVGCFIALSTENLKISFVLPTLGLVIFPWPQDKT